MKALLFLLLVPAFLAAQSYYSDSDSERFSAQITKASESLYLNEAGDVELKVSFPKEYELKTVAYEYDQSEFSWHKEKKEAEGLSHGQKEVLIKLQFDPQRSGNLNLNLPTLHLVSMTDPNKFVSLHPPLISCHILPYLEDPQEKLLAKDPVALDLRRPIEMNALNQRNLIEQSKEGLSRASMKLHNASLKKTWKALLICSILLLVGYNLLRWIQKKTKFGQAFTKERDPKELALEELRILKKQMLIQKGFFEKFYVQLTQIVRLYIERRFQVNAPEQTTQEFLIEVLEKPIFKTEMKAHLEEFLKFADLVKFAKLHPMPIDCEKAESAAYGFIESPGNEPSDENDDA